MYVVFTCTCWLSYMYGIWVHVQFSYMYVVLHVRVCLVTCTVSGYMYSFSYMYVVLHVHVCLVTCTGFLLIGALLVWSTRREGEC
jgi:hypothetical protein